MKTMKYILILIFFLLACNKPATKNSSAILSLLDKQKSGNCAVIEKSTLNGSTVYHASAKTVSSSECKEETFFSITDSSSKAKANLDKYYSNLALTLDKYDECSELIQTTIVERERVSETILEASANANSEGCIQFGFKYIYCKDAASKSAFQNKYRYKRIQDAKEDMQINYNSQVRINGLTNLNHNFQYSEGAILNLRIAKASEFKLFTGKDNYAFLTTYPQNSECFNRIVLKSTDLKEAYTKIPTLQGFFKEEITNSERKALTETITPELKCLYGNGVTAKGESVGSPAIGLCPSSYPSF